MSIQFLIYWNIGQIILAIALVISSYNSIRLSTRVMKTYDEMIKSNDKIAIELRRLQQSLTDH